MTRFLPKSTLLAIAVCLIAVIVANIWQRKSNADTREQIAHTVQIQQVIRSEPDKVKTVAVSAVDIKGAVEKLQLVQFPMDEPTMEGVLDSMIEVRAILSGLDAAERLELAEQLADQTATHPMVNSLALQALAEHDPVRAMEIFDAPHGAKYMERTRSMVLAEMVKLAPDAAWRELAPAVAEKKMTEGRAVGICEFLKTDISRALTLLEMDKEALVKYDAVEMITAAALESGAARGIWLAARTESNDQTRELLLDGLIVAEQHQRGVSGLRDALSEWSIEERRKILVGLDEKIVHAETGEIIDWMMSDLPVPERDKALSTAVKKWTKRDFNAVGLWLGEQESSAMRDSAILSFVDNVSDLDHEAAVAWAGEISDSAMRTDILHKLNGAKP
ncbi:MAG: hypothetical protein ACI9NC_004052 [Verrucomicrobiales bacterium]|jgi:hypothetical protein